MPLIRVDGSRIENVGQKRQMVEKLTNVAEEIYGMDKEHNDLC